MRKVNVRHRHTTRTILCNLWTEMHGAEWEKITSKVKSIIWRRRCYRAYCVWTTTTTNGVGCVRWELHGAANGTYSDSCLGIHYVRSTPSEGEREGVREKRHTHSCNKVANKISKNKYKRDSVRTAHTHCVLMCNTIPLCVCDTCIHAKFTSIGCTCLKRWHVLNFKKYVLYVRARPCVCVFASVTFACVWRGFPPKWKWMMFTVSSVYCYWWMTTLLGYSIFREHINSINVLEMPTSGVIILSTMTHCIVPRYAVDCGMELIYLPFRHCRVGEEEGREKKPENCTSNTTQTCRRPISAQNENWKVKNYE